MNTIRGKPKAGADPLQIQENNKSELSHLARFRLTSITTHIRRIVIFMYNTRLEKNQETRLKNVKQKNYC